MPVEAELPVGAERLVQARVPVEPGDPGRIETLPDGSISIPVFEEELVVTKRTVLRERIVIAKELVSELRLVQDTIQVEHVEVDPDPGIEVRGDL